MNLALDICIKNQKDFIKMFSTITSQKNLEKEHE